MSIKATFNNKYLPFLLMAPELLITLIFFFLPAGQSIWSSFFTEGAFGGNRQFSGLENYTRLFEDNSYYQAIGVTLIFAVFVTFIGLSVSLLLATMANRIIRGRKFYQTFLIIPYAIAPALIGTLAMFMFSPSVGIVSDFFKTLGFSWNPYLNGNDALGLAIGASIWSQLSYNFLFFFAGLQAIPHSLIEAAAIDGAGPWRRFKDIVFPLLAPTTFFLLVINTIYAFFETFAIIDVTTQGGPGTATTTLVYKVYKTAFSSYDYGSSGAQSVILMIFIMILTLIQFKYIEKKIHY